MAPKKALPPSPPESEEEEETSEEEESEEGEEEESDVEEDEKTTPIQPSPPNKKLLLQKQTTPPPPAAQSSESEEEEDESESEEEDEEESDSPPSPNVSDFTVKPIIPTKRPSDTQEDDEKESKNSKKMKTNEGEEKKEKGSAVSTPGGGGVGVGKVWSEEDQIALLQGMVDYQKKNGADPYGDKDAFHEFIRKKLQADISKNQLYDKVRRLKKKYFNNMEKAESGRDLVFSKPHESKAFDLSKKIWGNADGEKDGKIGSINGNVKESKRDDLVVEDISDDEGDFQSKYPFLSQSFDVGSSLVPAHVISSVKENLDLIDSVKAREWEEKWKQIRRQEAKIFLKKINLMTEQTELVLNARKKGRSGN